MSAAAAKACAARISLRNRTMVDELPFGTELMTAPITMQPEMTGAAIPAVSARAPGREEKPNAQKHAGDPKDNEPPHVPQEWVRHPYSNAMNSENPVDQDDIGELPNG